MQKWIMAILFYGAAALGLIGLFLANANKPTEKKEEPKVAMPSVTLNAQAAETQYKQSCIACHGNQLEGKIGPNLQKVGAKLTDEQIYKKILGGGGGMPAFKDQIKDEEVANLAQWLAQHK